MDKMSSMFFCIVTDYYSRGSLDAHLNVMHSRHQTIAESVSDVNYICCGNTVCLCICMSAFWFKIFIIFKVRSGVFERGIREKVQSVIRSLDSSHGKEQLMQSFNGSLYKACPSLTADAAQYIDCS